MQLSIYIPITQAKYVQIPTLPGSAPFVSFQKMIFTPPFACEHYIYAFILKKVQLMCYSQPLVEWVQI